MSVVTTNEPILRPPADSGVRRFLRWALSIGFVVGMGASLCGYANSEVQFAAVVLGFLGWVAWGALAIVVSLGEWLAARRGPRRCPSRVPWARWLWVAAPVCFGVCCLVRADAWVWFVAHRGHLDRLVAAAPQGGTDDWSVVDGRDVLWTPDGVFVVRLGGWMFEEHGVALDPHGRFVAGAVVAGRGVLRVTDLSGGWRAWHADD